MSDMLLGALLFSALILVKSSTTGLVLDGCPWHSEVEDHCESEFAAVSYWRRALPQLTRMSGEPLASW